MLINKITVSASAMLLLSLYCSGALAQSPERWFQIELSIFSNESQADRNEEHWQDGSNSPQHRDGLLRLKTLMDLLMIDELLAGSVEGKSESETLPDTQEIQAALYPAPQAGASDFKFYDFERDPLVQLPNGESDFQQTNRALQRSADYRLLFHGLWRQPVVAQNQASAIRVTGGQVFNEQEELQGSITIRFNDNQDRVVIDADLWLSEFSGIPPVASRAFHMQQSRDMRSTEFHYLDHPAMGIVILVKPYEVPEIPLADTTNDILQ